MIQKSFALNKVKVVNDQEMAQSERNSLSLLDYHYNCNSEFCFQHSNEKFLKVV